MMSDRDRDLQSAIDDIRKSYGKGVVWRMNELPLESVPCFSTGILSLDEAIGAGGIPRGRITEIFGDESTGKTTLALQVVAEVQRQGGICVYVDAENALDLSLASRIGVDVDSMIISQPDTGEQGLDIVERFVQSGAVDLVVVDSVAALVPRSELEGDIGDSHVGLQARLMSQALRKMSGMVSKSGTAVIFINQIRMKIGVLFGSPETTSGGKALPFYSSLRIRLSGGEQIKKGDQLVGRFVRAKCVKNKIAPPFRQASFRIYFGTGISRASGLIDLALQRGVIVKSGSWLTYGERRWQGEANFIEAVDADSALYDEIRGAVAEKA